MRRPIAGVVALLAAASAFAGVDVEVGNGDKVTGTISPAGATETFRVRVPKDATISVKAKPAKKGPPLSLHLAAPSGDGAGDAEGSAPSIKTVAAASGVFTLTVKSQDGVTAGDYSLSISWKSPTSFSATADLAANATSRLDFAADAGATVSLSAKPAKGSAAAAVLSALTGPGAAVEALAQPSAQRAIAVTDGYSLEFRNSGAAQGAVTATAKVKPPKPAKRKIALTDDALGEGDFAFAKVVGASGGTVSVPALPQGDPGAAIAGSSVTIPAGALGSATAIVIGTAPPLTPLSGNGAAGPTVSFGPDGLKFSASASVTIPYDPSFENRTDEFAVHTRDAKGKVSLVPPPYTVDHGTHTITCAASHFSRFVVALPGTVQPGGAFKSIATITDPRDVCEGSDTGSQANGVVQFFVAEGDAATVAAIRLKIGTGFIRETWAGGGAQTVLPVARGQFQFPGPVVAVDQDVSGYLFIATATRIYVITIQTGLLDVYAGTGAVGDTGDGGPAAQATFTGISKIVAVQNQGLYVADLGAHRVRFIDPARNISAFAGDGTAGVGADGGDLATTPFVGPTGIAAAPIVGIYVADGARIRWLSRTGPVGPINMTVAGDVSGGTGSTGDGGAPVAARFQSISDIVRFPPPLGSNDDLLMVSDATDHTIRLVNLTDLTVSLIAGAHGASGFNGETGTAPGLLSGPNALVGKPERVYVSDEANSRFREIEVK